MISSYLFAYSFILLFFFLKKIKQAGPSETPNYGPEYESVEKLRNGLGDLKKALVCVIPIISSFLIFFIIY